MDQQVQKRLRLIRDVVYRNLIKDYVPFPLDKKLGCSWAEGLKVPRGGGTLIYTSYMYQMASVFKSYARYADMFGSLASSQILASLGARFVKPSREDLERSKRILQNIYRMVSREIGGLGYLYEEEPYSGALLYELGFLDEFYEYGEKLLTFFKSRRVEMLVTVDPHTTGALDALKREAGFDIPFKPYLAYVKNAKGGGEFVLHDSCLYSRFLGMYDEVRSTIRGAGVRLVEDPRITGRGSSFCCGAPIGSVSETLSEEIAKQRAEALVRVAPNVLVACPLCYANLSKHCTVKDIAEVIV
ncbi:MAG: (Fe-S)-binding protein [Thermoprotei archaeon]